MFLLRPPPPCSSRVAEVSQRATEQSNTQSVLQNRLFLRQSAIEHLENHGWIICSFVYVKAIQRTLRRSCTTKQLRNFTFLYAQFRKVASHKQAPIFGST